MLAHRARCNSTSPVLVANGEIGTSSKHVRGFTLLELLVCVMIISLLAGLLLPAISSVRSNARRTQCTNNLFQIGQALNNYHDAHRTFPPGYASQVGSQGQDIEAGWSWAAMLLPFLGRGPMYQRALSTSADDDGRQIVSRRLGIFVCPSDAAASNYVASFGQGDMWLHPDDGDGVFFRNSRIRLRDLEDGLMTIMVGERSSDLGTAAWAGVYAVTESAKWVGAHQTGTVDRALVLGHTGALGTSHPVHPPNTVSTCGAGFGSMHQGGANFLMADGSVRFIGSQVDPGVFASLATRSGGEPMNLTDF
jgi:prepilin-type N-terminal cleavage/methylation domain-containing protein/prepilin-type processing-associated H-X9-DG protein